jgi:hypothetical protein
VLTPLVNSRWLETFPWKDSCFSKIPKWNPYNAVAAQTALGRVVKPEYFMMVGMTVALPFFG